MTKCRCVPDWLLHPFTGLLHELPVACRWGLVRTEKAKKKDMFASPQAQIVSAASCLVTPLQPMTCLDQKQPLGLIRASCKQGFSWLCGLLVGAFKGASHLASLQAASDKL